MIYFNNRYLSDRLSINNSKWKRWVREFLPADPLGGRQSGYARQLNLKDSFKVYLAGYLVSRMKFSIPEALMILDDLSPWLKQHGYFNLQLPQQAAGSSMIRHQIYIFDTHKNKYAYAVRGVINSKTNNQPENGRSIWTEEYEQSLIGTDQDELAADQISGARIVVLTGLYNHFVDKVIEKI